MTLAVTRSSAFCHQKPTTQIRFETRFPLKQLTHYSFKFLFLAAILLAVSGCATKPDARNLFPEKPSAVIDDPYGDSDQDGVVNYRDLCAQKVRGAIVDSTGCPLDSDGDGVPDYCDACPDTAPGKAACGFGCELIDPKVFNLVNDEFKFDRSELKPDMIAALNDFARQVLDHGDVTEMTIVGHTDFTGTELYNQGLSERRAQAVADYLRTTGLTAVTMEIRGDGESAPIADNKTKQGRAENRRVEIYSHSSRDHAQNLSSCADKEIFQ